VPFLRRALLCGAGLFTVLCGLANAAPSTRPIVFVPLDDRPVTLQLPVMLARIAGRRIVVPPRSMIGTYLRYGDPAQLLRWLGGSWTSDASAFVLSLDMLEYGGLVASRTPDTSLGTATVRLQAVAKLRAERPGAYVGVFGTVMRLAPTGLPASERTRGQWATGDTVDLIQAYANLPDPPRTPDERAKAERLRARIGEATLAQYLRSRERNREADMYALQLAGDGAFDRIVIGQDDAGPQGLHVRDVAALEAQRKRFGLEAIASIEPGADELGMVVLANALLHDARWTPAIRVTYSRPDGGSLQDQLEYVPIDVTIGRIIAASGARRTGDSPDIELFVRVPGTNDADEAAFEEAIAHRTGTGASVAVADLTFLEGEPGPQQRALTESLIRSHLAGRIDAFASWNTTANTIGTAIPEAIAAGVGRRNGGYDRRTHAEFLLNRYIDDYAFHQFVRPQLNATLRGEGLDTTLLDPPEAQRASRLNDRLLWPYAVSLHNAIFPDFRDAGMWITLPWDRTFETQIDDRLVPRSP
jgi:hypothetical protein